MAAPQKGKRFRYNLETVLKVRGIHEKAEQEKFSEADKKLQEEAEKERKIKDFQTEKYYELRDAMSGEISNFQAVLMRKSHLDLLKQKVEDQEQLRVQAEQEKEIQREKLVQAMKEKKIIEKDKDKKNVLWKRWREKEQNKFLDDIATVRFEHQRRDKLDE